MIEDDVNELFEIYLSIGCDCPKCKQLKAEIKGMCQEIRYYPEHQRKAIINGYKNMIAKGVHND